jgi:hypothetical protein
MQGADLRDLHSLLERPARSDDAVRLFKALSLVCHAMSRVRLTGTVTWAKIQSKVPRDRALYQLCSASFLDCRDLMRQGGLLSELNELLAAEGPWHARDMLIQLRRLL